jgi:hypothetical protein
MKLQAKIFILTGLILSIFLSSCSNGSATPIVTEVESTPLPPTISSQEFDVHNETAFTAYPIAENEALKWNPEATLYQIPPTRQMEQNIGLPPGGLPGWFFMFKEADSPVEFYVKVVDGKISGKIEAQPIIVGEPEYILVQLPVDGSLIDSDHALQVYLNDGGEEYYNTHPDVEFDFRLVHLDGQQNPVWSIFDAADMTVPLYHVDAVSGQESQDPFSQ